MAIDVDVAKCRSCGAAIIWTVTRRGKRQPVDAAPAPNGNLSLTIEDDGVVRSDVTGPLDRLMDDQDAYMPHHATCPQADEW